MGLFGSSFTKGLDKTFSGLGGGGGFGGLLGNIGQGLGMMAGGGGQDGEDTPLWQKLVAQEALRKRQSALEGAQAQQQPWDEQTQQQPWGLSRNLAPMNGAPMPYLNNRFGQRWG